MHIVAKQPCAARNVSQDTGIYVGSVVLLAAVQHQIALLSAQIKRLYLLVSERELAGGSPVGGAKRRPRAPEPAAFASCNLLQLLLVRMQLPLQHSHGKLWVGAAGSRMAAAGAAARSAARAAAAPPGAAGGARPPGCSQPCFMHVLCAKKSRLTD